jgi:hypothetical protein
MVRRECEVARLQVDVAVRAAAEPLLCPILGRMSEGRRRKRQRRGYGERPDELPHYNSFPGELDQTTPTLKAPTGIEPV